jgi:hypothetical protein
VLEFLLGAVGASGALAGGAALVRKARNYSGGWSESDIHRFNAAKGTTTPAWNSADYNRREPPPAFQPPAAPPAYYSLPQSQPETTDWGAFWKAQDDARRDGTSRFSEDGTWRESPKDTDPPPYDGPTGA